MAALAFLPVRTNILSSVCYRPRPCKLCCTKAGPFLLSLDEVIHPEGRDAKNDNVRHFILLITLQLKFDVETAIRGKARFQLTQQGFQAAHDYQAARPLLRAFFPNSFFKRLDEQKRLQYQYSDHHPSPQYLAAWTGRS